MLEIKDLRVGYGHLEVLHGVSLTVGDGEFVAVLGSNGAGKSTLLRTCAGLLKPWGGQVAFHGKDLGRVPPHQVVRMGVGYSMEGRRIFQRQTVHTNLELGAFVHGGQNKRTEELFDRVYDLFPVLRAKSNLMASTMSGGERQMLAIAQALMSNPRLLLLDEPSAGLAPRLVSEVFAALSRLREAGVSVLLAEQTVEQALRLCDRGYVLEVGTVALTGAASELRTNPAVREVYIGALGSGATRQQPDVQPSS